MLMGDCLATDGCVLSRATCLLRKRCNSALVASFPTDSPYCLQHPLTKELSKLSR